MLLYTTFDTQQVQKRERKKNQKQLPGTNLEGCPSSPSPDFKVSIKAIVKKSAEPLLSSAIPVNLLSGEVCVFQHMF